MMATTNGLEYYDAGAALWDANLMIIRYMGDFPAKVARQDVGTIQGSYQQAREFARSRGRDVSRLPEKLNLELQGGD